jgi:hypothetical protein
VQFQGAASGSGIRDRNLRRTELLCIACGSNRSIACLAADLRRWPMDDNMLERNAKEQRRNASGSRLCGCTKSGSRSRQRND